jgi:hypothetical protein
MRATDETSASAAKRVQRVCRPMSERPHGHDQLAAA